MTKFFYDRGGCGINIEPLRSMCKLLESERPRDINLCIGIDKKRGKLPLYGAGTGATFSDEIAEKSGMPDSTKHMTSMLTLSDIYKQYVAPWQQVHFCKIDVERFEKQVLESINNWDVFRPWIYVIESAEPGTGTPSHEKWEYILEENGYILAYMGKINRYYVDERKEHLLEMFEKTDDFLRENNVVRMEMENGKVYKNHKVFLFPFHKVPLGSNIILCGAGMVGIQYFMQVTKLNFCRIVGWVDQKYETIKNYKIQPIEIVKDADYDYIIIAILNKDIRQEVRQELLKYGVRDEKIIDCVTAGNS